MDRKEDNLQQLGHAVEYRMDYAPEVLETFENRHPDNDYWVEFLCPEFTTLCPITGQPDFAEIRILYIPDHRMVESKSLKLYLFSFRNHGDFHEDCVNIIMKDLVRLMEPRYLEPSSRLRWQKPVCVLTNRKVFSAANEFTMYMKTLPLVTIVGDHTGGGSGMPFSSSLPNGWGVRFSACPMFDREKKSTEFGIQPDYQVNLTEADFEKGRDTIIEFARKLINQKP